MKSRKLESDAKDGDAGPGTVLLTNALEINEVAKDLALEAAEELSSVNSVLKLELGEADAPSGIGAALEQSEAVEGKVQEVSEMLSVVNLALKDEVVERHLLEDKLALVIDQGAADRHAALHDALSGLPNRALFDDRLEHGIAQAQRRDRKLAVMFLDLDEFKAINDTHGHDVGDSVLRTIAKRLTAVTRSEDTVSRAGGDEFLFLLMEVQSDRDAVSIAKHIIDSLHRPCEVSLGQESVSLSVKASIGIALYPASGVTAAALIKSADTAMYVAKRAGSGYAFAS